MTSPEIQQTPQPEDVQEEGSAEELQNAENKTDKEPSLDETGLSEEAKKLEESRRTKEARKKDNELVLDWLISQGGITTGDAFFGKFKKVLEEKNEQNQEELDQAGELLRKLPELFKQVDDKIEELSKDETKYKEIGQKRIEIIKGICEPILDGHLSSEDAFSLVAGIEVVNKDDPNKKELFREAGIRNGYEGVMFYNKREHKIFLFEGTLVDDYKTEDGRSIKLDCRHMITHEMSHGIVERATKHNKILVDKANEIIDRATVANDKFADSQSQHIRITLNGVANAEADFDDYFDKSVTNSDTFKAMPVEEQGQFREAKKKTFINDRKIQAAAEILTDYTAMYLQSDGSVEDFVMTCLKKTNQEALKGYLGDKFNDVKLTRLNQISRPETKKLRMKDLGEAFPELVNNYQVFYDEIKRVMVSSKGKFSEPNLNEDKEDPFGEYSGAGFMDGSAGFGQQGQGQEQGGNRGGNGGRESLWSEFGALVKALSEEVPNVK